ncbi:hypothetical protein P8452_54328 [Trifolium repens]|nr:hypothetical protein P8452_54328 [Trifolium repens]
MFKPKKTRSTALGVHSPANPPPQLRPPPLLPSFSLFHHLHGDVVIGFEVLQPSSVLVILCIPIYGVLFWSWKEWFSVCSSTINPSGSDFRGWCEISKTADEVKLKQSYE